MPNVVGVRFKKAGKVYYFDPIGIDLKVRDCVVVQTARGVEQGEVVIAPKQVLASALTVELKPILRKATEEDIKRSCEFAAKEKDALAECAKMVAKLNLPMKLVSAEYNLDGSRLTFYFTAEERVDFRELVRELTGFFKTRIELRQIGPRDQAKIVGGEGRCGRQLCCCRFLTEFEPVSIKMAKEQDLPLDPMKISGVCGRLLCCLSYECAQYKEMKSKLPRKGQRVQVPSGTGFVTGSNPLKQMVTVEIESGGSVEVPVAQVVVVSPPAPEPPRKEAPPQAKKETPQPPQKEAPVEPLEKEAPPISELPKEEALLELPEPNEPQQFDEPIIPEGGADPPTPPLTQP